MSKLNVLLVDDHVVVREGLKRLIEVEADMAVVAEASDGRQAIQLAVEFRPDLVVMDISMHDMGGAEATRRMREECPASKVIALTVHEDTSYLRELLDAGAVGYVLKRAAADELIRAIRAVAAGGVYVDPLVASKVVKALAPGRGLSRPNTELSDRETAVLRLIAQGYTNKEIAGQLEVSVKTIETYKARSMEKLGLRSRVDIVRVGAERGWIPSR